MKFGLVFFIALYFSAIGVNGQVSPHQFKISLRTGDLLFCGASSEGLSKAIDQSTRNSNNTHFDHVGIVEIKNDTVWVLHAAPKKGVSRDVVSHFLLNDKNVVSVTVYRLKSNFLKTIPGAIKKAYAGLGQPYKYSYRLKDPGYYCSEYIYKLFEADSIFTLNAMSFKDPKTGQFLPVWVDHYKKLEIPVPEGEPGCNPNGLAASSKLELIGRLEAK